MNIARISRLDWESKWFAPVFSFISCSYLGEQYYHACRERWGVGLRHVLFVARAKGILCYQSGKENTAFGSFIARRISRQRLFAAQLSREVIRRSDELSALLRRPMSDFLPPDKFAEFEQMHRDYLAPFIAVNRSANYLTPAVAKLALKPLTTARLYSEDLYIEVDHWLQRLLGRIARRERRSARSLSKMFGHELRQYVRRGHLPRDRDLNKRGEGSGLYFSAGQRYWLSPSQVRRLERLFAKRRGVTVGQIHGNCAQPGRARGRVQVVHDPSIAKGFRRGDVLVTSMTRPEFLPLMKLAGAIVTDAGGVLSHAAIVSRELKVPCVIGTQVATQTLKDGDVVEVNATQGVVKKI